MFHCEHLIFFFDAILFTIIAKVKGYKLQSILQALIQFFFNKFSTLYFKSAKGHPLISKLFFAEGNTKKKKTHIFSVSLSLTKSIDAILNKNWFWFCIIPQTQVWPWYNLSSSSVPTKICFCSFLDFLSI